MSQTMKRALLALLALSARSAVAQGPTGEISGSAKDSSGGVAAGAIVTVLNPATNTRRTSASNASGNFSIPSLPPGVYDIRVELPGFTSQSRNGVALQVGNVAETVNVTGGAPVLDTETTSVGTVIENRRIVELPNHVHYGRPSERAYRQFPQ